MAIHNFSTYILSDEKMLALPHDLDHRITTSFNKNYISAEFEGFFKN